MLTTLLRAALGLLLVLLLALLTGVLYVRSQTLPQLSGTLKVTGLNAETTITRDRYGIPHIRASHDEDAIYALGLVHAQDRAWQLDFQRRIAQGRLAEVLGPAALEQDRFLRTWGFQRAAESALEALSPQSRQLIAAYTAGVNAGFALGKTAPEFMILGYRPEPWTDVDSVAWSKLMSFDLGGNWKQELSNWELCRAGGVQALTGVTPPYPASGPTILSVDELPATAPAGPGKHPAAYPTAACPADLTGAHLGELRRQLAAAQRLGMEFEASRGSNNWVVSGQHTASGKPLLADDPHLKLQSPMLWYLAEVQGERLHAIGATIPGLPAVVIGRNERVAWGVTNHNPDVQDLFVLPPDAPVQTRQEIIRVRGGEDVQLTLEQSEYGPVVSPVGGGLQGEELAKSTRLALSWPTLMNGDTTLDAFLGVNFAQNWDEFRSAMRHYVAPSQSFVYADVDGNTGYIAPGRVPVRRGWDGSLPAPADAQHRWTGWVPFGQLPQTFNPADGLVVTANNRSVPQEYPWPLTNDRDWADPYRAARITERLQGKGGLTLDDMAAVQNDTLSGPWREMKAALLSTPRAGLSREAAAALDRLSGWDGELGTDSASATVFEWWLAELKAQGRQTFGQEPSTRGVAVALAAGGALCGPTASQTVGSSCTGLLARTLEAAVQQAARRPYGEVHQALSTHGAFGEIQALAPLFNALIPAPGGSDTVNVARPDREDGTLHFTHAASYRQLIDLSDPDASRFTGSLGQSGNPFSPHARDQLRGWAAGEYLPMSTDPADWGRTRVLHLKPVSEQPAP
ncbi:penicillin acylase family protein [Deinococcus sp. SL84]|uniref:penicillin acylase family protein n=1 Tax=Deinococcus sp. SL84 TaxID=2994663 RepID=UPI002275EAA6|nr:penicillin acylase family protein [Deinococcus sp. SL84]MCY1704173.1 penicillin acylase family protein [Deinococcus sp. SL84]